MYTLLFIRGKISQIYGRRDLLFVTLDSLLTRDREDNICLMQKGDVLMVVYVGERSVTVHNVHVMRS